MTIEQILAVAKTQIVRNWDQQTVKTAIRGKKQLVPILLDHMNGFYEQICDPRRVPDKASIILFRNGYNLLGAMRETGAYPILLKCLALPTRQLNYVFDYDLSEGLRQVLCSVYDGNLAETERLAADISADQMARGTVVYAMGLLCQEGRIPRKELVRFLREVLVKQRELDDALDNEGFLIGVTETMELLHLHELCRELRDLVVCEAINVGYCINTLDRVFQYDGITGKMWSPKTLPAAADSPTAQERQIMRWGANLNEPCPCGSGKKFKNCCKRKQEELCYRYLDDRSARLFGDPNAPPKIIYPPVKSRGNHPGLDAYFPAEGIAVDEHAYRGMCIVGGEDLSCSPTDAIARIAAEELWEAFAGFQAICGKQGYHTPEEYDKIYAVHYRSRSWLLALAKLLKKAGDSRRKTAEMWLFGREL